MWGSPTVWGLILGAFVLVFLIVYMYPSSGHANDECHVIERKQQADGTVLEIVTGDCKEGMPHTTTADTIRMTRDIENSPRYDIIMAHERVHLDQKQRPAVWRALVKRIWSYDLYEKPPSGIPVEWVRKRRPNPDTESAPWAVWRGRYVFFAAFTEEKLLRTAPVLVWDLESNRLVEVPPEWRGQFCWEDRLPHQYEHPYELAAEYMAEPTHKNHPCPAAAALFASVGTGATA